MSERPYSDLPKGIDPHQLKAMEGELDRLRQVISDIDACRQDEGDSIEILCDNPDEFDTDKQACVQACCSWTNWKTERFYGMTWLIALRRAADVARNPKRVTRLEKMEKACRLVALMFERIDNRCLAVDGPVPKTPQEMTADECRQMYLACKDAVDGPYEYDAEDIQGMRAKWADLCGKIEEETLNLEHNEGSKEKLDAARLELSRWCNSQPSWLFDELQKAAGQEDS